MGNAAAENQRVRSAITEALFTLMKQKHFSEISVSDIVKEAGIARASFYRNFETKEAVVDAFIRNFHQNLYPTPSLEYYRQADPRERMVQRLERSFSAVLAKKSYVLALFDNGFSGRLQTFADAYMEEFMDVTIQSSADRYLLYCFSGAGMNVLVHWLRSGAVESPHEVAVSTTEFFLRGVRAVLPGSDIHINI